MSKMQRTKGHQFERDVAIQFQEMGWDDARRQLEYHVKDAIGVDLQGTEPFAVQCKRGRQYAPITSIEEISRAPFAVRAFVPVLITKADRKPAMAVLPWSELQKLIRMAFK